MISKEEKQYIAWLEETLIPDLKESGTVETAADFEHCIRIIEDLDKRLDKVLEFITSDPA